MTRPRIIDHTKDGEEHINVYSRAQTPLGRDLSHWAHKPFCHPEFGNFASVEGLWYWLTRQDDSLRHLHGWDAKSKGRDLPAVRNWHPERFRQIILQANEAKLERHPDILEALGKTELRLEHYYLNTYGGVQKVQHARDSDWLLAHFESIRKRINPSADMYHTIQIENRLKAASVEPDQISLF